MKAKEFFDLVAKMREAQREYFCTRSASALGKARTLEETIDREITRVRQLLQEREDNAPQQTKLF